MICDPCDSWPLHRNYAGALYRIKPTPEVQCFEGFEVQSIPPVLAKFLPFVRTDFNRWQHDLEWTLESGPDDAPSSIDIMIPYNYRGSTPDSWTEPGDAAEVETGTAMYFYAAGDWCEVNLTTAETERVELHICENPPEPDYREDY